VEREILTMPADWTDDDVMRWLDDFPLPADFTWTRTDRVKDSKEKILTPNTAVRPAHLGVAYGKWLRETPYFPGLFEQIRDIIREIPPGATLPTPEELATRLRTGPTKTRQATLF
jgi:hypothetical protein